MAGSPIVLSWSGGKDAVLCLKRMVADDMATVECLLTVASEEYCRSSQHGVRIELVEEQARRLGLPLHTVWLPPAASLETYNRYMDDALTNIAARGIDTAAYGDVFLEDLRTFRERRLTRLGMTGRFPLWQQPTDKVARSFLDAGFRAVVVCVNAQKLDRNFVGRPFDHTFLDALPDGVDPCGEHGEFHTFVYDGPLFSDPVPIERGKVVYRTYETRTEEDPNGRAPCTPGTGALDEPGFWYCDVVWATEEGGEGNERDGGD